MSAQRLARQFLELEARALRTRIDRLMPFSVSMTMVPAASVPVAAMAAIESLLRRGRQTLRMAVARFIAWLQSPAGRAATPADAQRRFMVLRLRFHTIIAQFDLFADILVQRSEHGNGVWIAGLDDLAADALAVPGHPRAAPPLVCYLDRGVGAAIRRARTRLPGGDLLPVAVIRVPRERMIGQGIGSSLVHEVGHQAAALLDLLPLLRTTLLRKQRSTPDAALRAAWICLEKWCSEIIADFWAVAQLGVSATLGLMGVVSLPKAFVFRVELDDPHPFPWIRVMVSAALGDAMYPHAQWKGIATMWEAMYPPTGLAPETTLLIRALRSILPEFAALVMSLRPQALRGETLGGCMRRLDRSPARLAVEWERIRNAPDSWHRLPPTLTLAALSQARVDGRLSPEHESQALQRLLTEWAVQSALKAAEASAAAPAGRDADQRPPKPRAPYVPFSTSSRLPLREVYETA